MSEEKALMAPVPATEEIPMALAAIPVNIESLERSIAQAEKYMRKVDTIRKLSIGVTNEDDWIDQQGHPYLLASGCHKIAAAFGVSVTNTKTEKEVNEDEEGVFYIYKVKGDISWQNHNTSQEGNCSTRDSFFCTKNGQRLPLSEIDICDLQKKAMTNFLNRAIKTVLGLSFTWEEIAQYSNGKIGKNKTTKVSYKSNAVAPVDASDDEKALQAMLGKILMEMSSDNKPAAMDHLEALTSFTGKDGKLVKGIRELSKLKSRRLEIAVDRAKKEHEEWKKNMAEAEGGAA